MYSLGVLNHRLAGWNQFSAFLFTALSLVGAGAASARRDSPQYATEVYFLGRVKLDENRLELLGTCFAVTRHHVLTTHHNLLDESENLLTGRFVISRESKKQGENHVFAEPINVDLVQFDLDKDWALLEIERTHKGFDSYIPVCPEHSLPDPLRNEKEELKAYIAPIGFYLQNDIESSSIWAEDYGRVKQYDRGGAFILVDGGLYRGSCGAPYINHSGEAVAMHCASMHEGKNLSTIKRLAKRKSVAQLSENLNELDDRTTDLSDVHNSLRQGIVIARLLPLMEFIDNVNSSACSSSSVAL